MIPIRHERCGLGSYLARRPAGLVSPLLLSPIKILTSYTDWTPISRRVQP